MSDVINATLDVRPGAGQGKTIPLPIVTLAVLQADGTAKEITAQEPLPTGDSGSNSSGLTFSTVIITEAAAGIADLGVVANATDVIRLHGLALTMGGQGTMTISYDDDAAATNDVPLTGPVLFGAGGGINIPFDADPRGKLTTIAHATAKHMVITFATTGGDGWAIISKGAA